MTINRSKADTYISISCVIPADLEDELPELLAPLGVLGTEIGESSDRGTCVAVYLSGDNVSGAEAVRRALADHGSLDIKQGLLEADDWLAAYRNAVVPFEIGDGWWIDPHPDRPTAPPSGRRRLVVEPRMAFGSGSHESTQAILLALEVIEIAGRSVLDVGTGTGILALAAERMGARPVVGLDIDETAIWVALETARHQDWAPTVDYILGPVGCLGEAEFDIVLCNMIASKFLPLAGELRKRLGPDGSVIFSGVLTSEVDAVSASLRSSGLRVVSTRVLGDWVSLVATEAVGQ